MRKSLLFLFSAAFLCFFSLSSCTVENSTLGGSSSSSDPNNGNGGDPQPELCLEANGPVACYGRLKASGNKLIGSKVDSAVQLRGVSLGWSNPSWESGRFFTAAAVNAMVDGWKAEIIRVPMGCTANSCVNSTSALANANNLANNMNNVRTAIDAAIAKGAYVIIDWHSHNAHNEVAAATNFFREMARDYGSYEGVIFEIYNEPICSNGANSCAAAERTTWAEIKNYAEVIIPIIREHSQNLILVGTPSWCQQVNAVLQAPGPLADDNVAYVLHFYAHTHAITGFATRMNPVLEADYPVFISEYGTTDANGGTGSSYGTHNGSRADEWFDFMDQHKISSAAWNVNDKNEGSAFFGMQNQNRSFDMTSWTSESRMSASGQYIYNKLRAYAEHADWRGH